MAAAPDPWASIKAAYLRDGDYAAIATGRKLGIRTLEVIPRIRAWKAEAAAPPPEPPRHEIVLRSPTIDVTATPASVTSDHQRLAAHLRGMLEHELEELQAMLSMTSSFVDRDTLEMLKLKAVAGDPKPYTEYVTNAVKARKLFAELLEKLARAIPQAIQSERSVWGLDGDQKGNGADRVDWVRVLEDLRKPLAPLSLPEGVVDFERKLRERDAGRRLT